MAANSRRNAVNLDALLERTLQPRPRSVRPPTKINRRPLSLSFRQWAVSQVAAYRLGLVLGYLSMMYFGGQAFYAGIPTFTFTTPEGWTPVWSSLVVAGGLVAAIGATRAGSEPITKTIKVYNTIELVGAIILFLTLGTFAAVLLWVGYGYGDPGRQSIGAGFVALGIPATIRMLWLFARPRFKMAHPIGPILIPEGYVLVKREDLATGEVATPKPETDTGLPGGT